MHIVLIISASNANSAQEECLLGQNHVFLGNTNVSLGKKYVFLSGESFVIADQTPAHTMENVGEGYAVMLVNAVAAEGLETVVMAKP